MNDEEIRRLLAKVLDAHKSFDRPRGMLAKRKQDVEAELAMRGHDVEAQAVDLKEVERWVKPRNLRLFMFARRDTQTTFSAGISARLDGL